MSRQKFLENLQSQPSNLPLVREKKLANKNLQVYNFFLGVNQNYEILAANFYKFVKKLILYWSDLGIKEKRYKPSQLGSGRRESQTSAGLSLSQTPGTARSLGACDWLRGWGGGERLSPRPGGRGTPESVCSLLLVTLSPPAPPDSHVTVT